MKKASRFFIGTLAQGIVAVSQLTAQIRVPPRLPLTELSQRLNKEHVDLGSVQSLLYWPTSKEEADMFRQSFRKFKDKADKQTIASALVEIGEGDDEMFAYLKRFAEAAIEHSAPIFIKYDAAGHAMRKEYSEAFEVWCKRNKVDVQSELKLQMFDLPADVRAFARTLDPRSATVLTRGIHSDNPWIALECAKALGLQGRNVVLPELISMIAQMPEEAKQAVATSLPYFNDERAASALERFIPDSNRRAGERHEASQVQASYRKKLLGRHGVVL